MAGGLASPPAASSSAPYRQRKELRMSRDEVRLTSLASCAG